MNWVAACADCGWIYQDADQETVSDALERHSRKEHHHVDIRRQPVASA